MMQRGASVGEESGRSRARRRGEYLTIVTDVQLLILVAIHGLARQRRRRTIVAGGLQRQREHPQVHRTIRLRILPLPVLGVAVSARGDTYAPEPPSALFGLDTVEPDADPQPVA